MHSPQAKREVFQQCGRILGVGGREVSFGKASSGAHGGTMRCIIDAVTGVVITHAEIKL